MQNIDPEYSAVGGLLLAPALLPDVQVWLRPGDFRQPAPRLTYEVMLSLHHSGHQIEPRTVHAELVKRRWIRPNGFPVSELRRIVDAAPLPHRTVEVAQQVLRGSMSREVGRAGLLLTDLASKELDPIDLFKRVQAPVAVLEAARRRWNIATNDRIPPIPVSDRHDPVHVSSLLSSLDLEITRGRAAS